MRGNKQKDQMVKIRSYNKEMLKYQLSLWPGTISSVEMVRSFLDDEPVSA